MLALLAACTSVGVREADRYFLLEPAVSGNPGPHATVAVALAPTSAASFYDTQDIVFSRAPGMRAYYQFSHWTERPQRAIHAALARRFTAGGGKAAHVLATRVEEIYHDAAQAPGTVHIALTAELVDRTTGEVRATRAFARTAPAASYDAPGAVLGFNVAAGRLVDDVAGWVDAELAVAR